MYRECVHQSYDEDRQGRTVYFCDKYKEGSYNVCAGECSCYEPYPNNDEKTEGEKE